MPTFGRQYSERMMAWSTPIFEKKNVDNIDSRELEAFRDLAEVILGYTDAEIEQRGKDGALFNVEEPGEDNA